MLKSDIRSLISESFRAEIYGSSAPQIISGSVVVSSAGITALAEVKEEFSFPASSVYTVVSEFSEVISGNGVSLVLSW